jgi:hypothetical protein
VTVIETSQGPFMSEPPRLSTTSDDIFAAVLSLLGAVDALENWAANAPRAVDADQNAPVTTEELPIEELEAV